MQINITRKPKNTRFGSLAWAATLPADKWSWKTSRRGNGIDRIDIYNGDVHIGSLPTDGDPHVPLKNVRNYTLSEMIEDSVEYGAELIGEALMSCLREWAKTLDLTIDDQGKMVITSA